MTELIRQIRSRLHVGDLDAALPTYQRLAETQEIRRLSFPQFDLAIVGPFMLMQGDREVLKDFQWVATLIVSDLDAAVASFTDNGGRVIDGPVDTGAGERTIVEDQDGNTFECFKPRETVPEEVRRAFTAAFVP